MAEVLLFHHAQGLTTGVQEFADGLRKAGHTVHVPDLYGGRTFDDLGAGVDFARETGFGTILARGKAAAEGLPAGIVTAGFSLGAMSAQALAQTRPGVKGALFFHSCVPVSEFGGDWPASVPVQIHSMDHDPSFVDEGDIDAARELVASAPDVAELFLYPGSGHLFADPSLGDYDAEATALLTARVLDFLAAHG